MHRLTRGMVLAGIAALASPVLADETYYRYVGRDGRAVYTNIQEQVPPEQRDRGRLDLSRIELNTEIGSEIDRRLEQEHAALAQSDYCQQLRQAAERGFWPQLWDEFGPLLVCGGLLLAFLLFTPAALRRFGAPVWAKTLMMAIPALGVAGVLMFSIGHTNTAMSELRQRLRPCATETFADLKSAPNPVLQHARLLEQLKRDMASIDAER